MDKLTPTSSSSQIWHPSDEDLLFYCDGELSHRPTQKVKEHLNECWPCRVRQEDLAKSIYRVTKYRNRVLDARLRQHSQDDAPAVRRFEARLQAAAVEMDRVPSIHRWFRSVVNTLFSRQVVLRIVPPVLAAVLIAFVLFRLNSAPPVSAAEVLQRSAEAQALAVRQVPQPVVYQKLRVRRGTAGFRPSEAFTWELWNDTSSRRLRQKIEDDAGVHFLPEVEPNIGLKSNQERALATPVVPAIVAEVEQILQTNHMDRRSPLSADSYRSWRKSALLSKEEVVEVSWPQNGKALQIKTSVAGPYADHAIISAELTLRPQDWHPVQQRLQVQTPSGAETYELAEQAFQVVTMSSVPSSVFSDVPATAPFTLPEMASPSQRPATLSRLEVLEAEIEARYALHRLQACLGEPIEIVRDRSGRVEVRGLVATGERKEELIGALKALALLKISVQTVDEAVSTSAKVLPKNVHVRAKSPVSSQEQEATKFEDTTLPIQTQLERYFKTLDASGEKPGAGKIAVHLRIAELSKQAISCWEPVMADAWALRQLSESFSTEDLAKLRSSYSWLLESMVHDHVEALAREVNQAQGLLSPVLSSVSFEEAGTLGNQDRNGGADASPEAPAPDLRWKILSLKLFDQVEEARTLIHGLFGGAGLETKEDMAVRRLLSRLSGLESGFHLLEAQVRREFSESAERVSQNRN